MGMIPQPKNVNLAIELVQQIVQIVVYVKPFYISNKISVKYKYNII